MPLFFFSCNGEDADGALLDFFHDLNSAVAQQAGISADSAGFIYLDGKTVGKDWSISEGQALAQSPVFVPVYTPRYMRSHNCGREYFAFRERLKHAGLGWDRILPLWWVPVPDDLPKAISHVVDSRQLKDIVDHREHGMRLVFDQRQMSSSMYPVLVSTLAQIIVRYSRASPVLGQSGDVNLASLPSLFDQPAEQAKPVMPRGGPKRVHFLILAGTDAEMRTVPGRTRLDYYGYERDDWNPFHPDVGHRISLAVSRIALENNLDSFVDPLPDDSMRFISMLEERREMVVILVDSWATYIDSLATILRDYDQRRFRNSAIVVPFPARDDETSSSELDLRNALYTCIARVMEGEPTLYRDDAATAEEFLGVIEQVLHELRKRVIAQAPPAKRLLPGAKARMPLLAAPRSPR